MSNQVTKHILTLENVRLSFPAIFQPKKFAPTDTKSSYNATFILDKKVNAKAIATVKASIDSLIKEVFKGKNPGQQKLCLRDGSEKSETDGYGEGVMFINARCEKRPLVVNRDLTPLTEDDGIVYAGCYVYAKIEVWAQDNLYGRRINAKLRSIQFYKDGKKFGEGAIDPTKEFQVINDDDESPV